MATIYNSIQEKTVGAGATVTVEIPAPYRGNVMKVIVYQRTGNAKGFTFTVYDNAAAAAGTATYPARLYKVMAALTAGDSVPEASAFGRYAYCNQDGQTVNTSKLYGVLTSASDQSGIFGISVTIENEAA